MKSGQFDRPRSYDLGSCLADRTPALLTIRRRAREAEVGGRSRGYARHMIHYSAFSPQSTMVEES
jgi:hypothetical protein